MPSSASVPSSGRFDDLAAAARALAGILPAAVRDRTDVVVGLGEPARVIADQIAVELSRRTEIVQVDRGDAPIIGPVPDCSGLDVLLVDRGVETGQAALLVATALREAGAGSVTLAVPVCPRQAEAVLMRVLDEVIAVHRPLARRSLQWHYVAPLE